MNNKFSFFPFLVALLSAMACCGPSYETVTGFAQGGYYSVKYSVSGANQTHEVISCTIDSLLQEIEMTFSGYNSASMLSRFNRGDSVLMNDMFAELYSLSYGIGVESGGAVDISCSPVFDLWGFGFKHDSLPSAQELDSAAARCGLSRILSPQELGKTLESGTIVCSADFLRDKSSPAPELNFNAVAQGYTCDVIARYLHSVGVTDMLVDIGEIYCAGKSPRGTAWSVAVDNPVDGNETPGADTRGVWTSCGLSCGIVTSGNYRKFYVRDGHKYAHTIDPRTYRPVEHDLLSATVVAPSAFRADALATWFMVVGADQAKAIVSTLAETEAYLISSESTWNSDGFTFRR